MDYTRLGHTGLQVSRLCLGCMTYGDPALGAHPWSLPEEPSRALIRAAVEAGINFFDTANIYSNGSSEEIVGRALRDFARRDELVVATKLRFGWRKGPNTAGLSRKVILAEADASLQRLGMDHVDLLQIHRWDPDTPIEETLEALHDLVKAGKTRYIGASSMFAWQFCKALYTSRMHGWSEFVSMQNYYNLLYREEEREMIPLARDQGVGLLPWSPLARGFLAGNRGRDDRSAGATARARTDDIALKLYYDDADFSVLEAVKALAQQKGVSNATLAYAWLLSRPGVTSPIVGASQVWQLEEAVKALDVTLKPDECAALEAPYRPHAVLGHS